MEENNRDIEMMKQLIARKHEKSASQGSVKKRPEDRFGTTSHKIRKQQKNSAPSDALEDDSGGENQ